MAQVKVFSGIFATEIYGIRDIWSKNHRDTLRPPLMGPHESCVYPSNKTSGFRSVMQAILIQFTPSHVYKNTDSSFINLFSNLG